MSTVTPSTSNIERSANFLSKNAQAKNQASNPIANAFAALLMSAEDGDTPVSSDAAAPLTGDGRDAAAINPGDDADSPSDFGQAALAGLLNWQALAAADTSAQVATGTVTPSIGSATPATPSAIGNTTPSGVNTNPPVNVLSAQIDPSKSGKWAVEASTGYAPPASSASPFAQGVALASSQATIPIPTAMRPEQSTPASNAPPPGIDVSGMVPTEISAATVPTSTVASATSQAPMETLASGADRTSVAKTRMGASRNQLSTSAATIKAGAGTTLQSLASNGKTTETSFQPRATVDLVARPATEVAPDTAKVNAPANDSETLKQEGPRLAAETGSPGTEHMQTGDHTPTASTSTDPTTLTGMDQNEMVDLMDNLGGQIAYWATQGTQSARLTVGDDKDNPLEVNISMRDGEVHVAFEAADAEVRDALTLSAEDLLKNMLETKGMTLGDVTVGQRPPFAGQGDHAPGNRQASDQAISQRAASGGQSSASAGTTAPLAQPLRRPAIATATKLDLFA